MNVFLFMVLSLFGGSGSNEVRDNCDRLKITYDTQVVGDKITISVHAKGGTAPYFYIFFDHKNNPLTWDLKTSSCIVDKTALPKFVKVADSGGCVQQIEIDETIAR